MNKINRVTTIDNLIKVPIPAQTNTYKPFSHKELDDLVRRDLNDLGFLLKNPTYLQAKDGLQAGAYYYIDSLKDKEMGLMIGWQNSYDKKYPVKFAIGGHVFICTNGCIIGDKGIYVHKHQTDVQELTPGTITNLITSATEELNTMIIHREKMKEIQVTKKTCAELIGRMYLEQDIINTTQLNIIKDQMNNPSFDYGAKGSLWEAYNHVTYALKNDHPSRSIDRHIDTHKFFTKEFSIA